MALGWHRDGLPCPDISLLAVESSVMNLADPRALSDGTLGKQRQRQDYKHALIDGTRAIFSRNRSRAQDRVGSGRHQNPNVSEKSQDWESGATPEGNRDDSSAFAVWGTQHCYHLPAHAQLSDAPKCVNAFRLRYEVALPN